MPTAPKLKIPKDDVLEFVVRDILRQRAVESQQALAELVNRKFEASNSGFRVSPQRARHAALRAGSKLVIKTKKGSSPSKCPGCGRRLKKSYMKNLKGRNAIFGMKCAHCGYDGRSGKWAPGKYGFSMV
jgi:hypothetical protein